MSNSTTAAVGATTPDSSPAASSGQRAGVMSRLHALFPGTPQVQVVQYEPPPPMSVPSSSVPVVGSSPPQSETPKFLKIRMLTWNMYDSLPKGDLEELLGCARSVEPAYIPHDPQALPDLSLDNSHPYHLVVVACQECPTVSGLPRGLGAPEFKLKELHRDKSREKDKEREKDKDKDELSDRSNSNEPEKSKEMEEKEREREKDRPRSLHRFHIHRHHSQHRISHDDFSSSSPSLPDHAHHPQYGWSAMLEDWYVHGRPHTDHGTDPPVPGKSPLLGVPNGDESPMTNEEVHISPKAKSTGDLTARMDQKTQVGGPYELLIKERMMGLYLAVYINRDIKGLVKGTSKASVTAGLIGGRVGNKGAVGISINLNGKTFLFVNAHLAAHGGKMHHRIANLTKIKTELAVDSFLSSDDPRFLREDLTERFDHTFFCGDLNFRLDITRLHADWLISRKEYAQALAFDQLRKVMESEEAFVGFQEANIDFPPTFKYDVLRTLKRSKTKRSSKGVALDPFVREKQLTEIEEREDREREEDDDEVEGGEATSIASSMWTSVHSRYTVEPDEREAEQDLLDDDFAPSADTLASTRANVNPGNVVQKILTAPAAHKAKAKWMSLVRAPGRHRPWSKVKKKLELDTPSSPISPTFMLRAPTLVPSMPDASETRGDQTPVNGVDDKFLKPLRASLSGRLSPTKPSRKSDEIDEQEDDDKGVYDSSHKKRVPSWCDRILWKSTVELRPYAIAHAEEPPLPSPPRTLMGNFFFSLRPGTRNRKDSHASTNSAESGPLPLSPNEPETPDTAVHSNHPSRRNSNSNSNSPRTPRLPHTQSYEPMGSPTDRPTPTKLQSLNEATARAKAPPPPARPTPPYAVYKPRHHVPPPPPSSTTSSALCHDASSTSDVPPPLPPKDVTPSRGWLTNLLPFLSRDNSASQTNLPLENSVSELPPRPPPPPMKGEVVCLEYRTLDDKGMRKLEGRSDHRPVIGSYAVYF